MGNVNLSIGGNSYLQSCKDGDEEHLFALGAIIDQKVLQATGSVGAMSEVRGLLLAALLLADELQDARKGVAPTSSVAENAAHSDPQPWESVALRLEKLASYLENGLV